MNQDELSSNPKLSLVELTPALIPYFLGFFVFRGFFANFPIYLQIKQNLTEVETVEIWALISGTALLVGALTRLPSGLLSDKIGRSKAFVLAYIVYVIALITVLLVDNTILYLLAMSIIRLGMNLIAMTGRGVVAVSKRDKGIKNGLLSSMVGLGSFAGPAFLGYILENYDPDLIITVSLIVIVIDFTLFIVSIYGIPRYLRSKRPDEIIDLDFSGVDKIDIKYLYSGLKRTGVSEAFFLFFSAGMIYGLITSVFTIYGYNVLNISIDFLGFIIGAGSLVQMVWAPIVGKLYQIIRDEIMRLFAWSTLLIATGFMIFSSSGPTYFIIGYFILHFGNASYLTMEITRIGKVVEKEEFSFVFGIATSLILLASAISGYISPLFYNILPEGTFYGALFFSLLSLAVVIYTTRKWSKLRADHKIEEAILHDT